MNKDMENTFNRMAELGGSDERLGMNTTPVINAPLLPKNTRPTPVAPVSPGATGKCLNLNIDKEWFERKAAQEGDLEIGAGRRTATLNLTPEEMDELKRLAFEALPQWAQDELTRLRAATGKCGELETVGYAPSEYGIGLDYQQLGISRLYPKSCASGAVAVVTRSQAEELLAAREAERAEQWRLRREMEADRDTQKAIAASLEADNAALTARVKEYETGLVDFHREMSALEAKLAAAKSDFAKDVIGDAATRYCGEKDRETFLDDILYFRNNWRASPGLTKYVVEELARAALGGKSS